MNFINLLKGKDNFRIVFRGQVFNSKTILEYSRSIASMILENNKIIEGKYFVFFPRNNLESFIYYCVNSLLGATAFICTKENLSVFLGLIPKGKVIVFIAAQDITTPTQATSNISIDYSLLLTDSNSMRYGCIFDSERAGTAKYIFTTSGTTGKPKLILYSETRLLENADAVVSYLPLNESSISICIFPLQYMYGLSTSICALLSNSELHFFHGGYNKTALCEYISNSKPTILPALGDWFIELSKALHMSKLRIPYILNASDKLLTSQAEAILSNCDVLWNNFGQTESGPRIFFNKLESISDIKSTSLNEVVAPDYIMNDQIKTSLINVDIQSGFGELVYSTPYCMDGYLDENMNLLNRDVYFESGDIFKIDSNGCHFWLKRKKEDLKVNGRFFPGSIILNDFSRQIGILKSIFTKNESGDLVLYIETSTTPPENIMLCKIESIIKAHWRTSTVAIKLVENLKRTASGKIKLQQ